MPALVFPTARKVAAPNRLSALPVSLRNQARCGPPFKKVWVSTWAVETDLDAQAFSFSSHLTEPGSNPRFGAEQHDSQRAIAAGQWTDSSWRSTICRCAHPLAVIC